MALGGTGVMDGVNVGDGVNVNVGKGVRVETGVAVISGVSSNNGCNVAVGTPDTCSAGVGVQAGKTIIIKIIKITFFVIRLISVLIRKLTFGTLSNTI